MAEWISAIAESITALSIIFLFFQLQATKQQLRDDHERSRRQAAIDNLLIWTNSINPETSSARKLVETFTRAQCEQLEAMKSLRCDESLSDLLHGSFPTKTFKADSSGQITLDPADTAKLRAVMVRYVNTLESIMASWRHNVADKQIIREEFGFLFRPEKGHYLLKSFREAIGEKNYPAIGDFESDLRKSQLPGPGEDSLGRI